MQPRCWAKRFFIPKDEHKANTLRPEPILLFWACSSWGDESLPRQWWHPFNRTFTALLALLRCCNSSSWSWTLGRRSLKRLMAHLVKFLHLKVPKYPGNISKRKFEGVLPQVTFEPSCAPKQDQPNHSCWEGLASPALEVFGKQGG